MCLSGSCVLYDCGLVNNSFLKALAVEGARVFLSAFADRERQREGERGEREERKRERGERREKEIQRLRGREMRKIRCIDVLLGVDSMIEG